jgi:RNA polymerase sigma-70 factor (ECF subfamily)
VSFKTLSNVEKGQPRFLVKSERFFRMPEMNQQPFQSTAGPSQFTTTHWSVVLTAATYPDPTATAALEELCRTYWFPLYAFVRRRGMDGHSAQDVVQGFFAQLLEHRSICNRTPEKGRFRSFLLASMNYYLADLADHERAAKRGGGQVPLALDALAAEERYRLEPVDRFTPEMIYERRWALALLDRALARLDAEFNDPDRGRLFQTVRPILFDPAWAGRTPELAASLGMSPGALRVATHRIRQRFRQLFREEVAWTVEDPSEIEEELRYLQGVLAAH